ncbi:MAG TPA: cytochrome C [Burkholderiaceae bacterium]|nr:cytochrome C [Burkholderiaceae bacterium]
MHTPTGHAMKVSARRIGLWTCAALALLMPLMAQALPVFARQTGQNCVACHAGGQFPELTPYGRLFKLTGYTIGERNGVPLSVMALASYTKTRNAMSDTPSVDFPKDAVALFQTGSVFLAGKITNNLGLFAQVTYDNYANQNPDTLAWSGHSHADNIDVRYADRFIDDKRDVIFGFSLNNNPSVADVWSTVPAWIQYVPTRFGFTGPSAAPLIAQLGQQVAGMGAYVFWNKMIYAELTAYQAAKGAFSLLSQGNDIGNRLRGANPYLRVALSHEWGPHNAMIGLFGMTADVYPDPTVPSGPTTRFRDRGIDAQYQYILDPHTVTAQVSYIRENISGGDVTGISSNGSNTLNQLKLKGSYIYRAKYGASLSYFSTTGSSDATLYPGLQDDGTGTGNMIPIPINGSLTNNPDTRGWIPELFWTPVQYMRVGLQYFKFDRFNGASSNYDGAGRNAADNNTLFLYLWAAY